MNKKKKISTVIKNYTTRAKEKIVNICSEFLNENVSADFIDSIFACIDELIKNAVKANYKFLVIVEGLGKKLKLPFPDKSDEEIKEKFINVLGTKIHIKGSLSKGKIEISYYSADDLDRIYEIIANE